MENTKQIDISWIKEDDLHSDDKTKLRPIAERIAGDKEFIKHMNKQIKFLNETFEPVLNRQFEIYDFELSHDSQVHYDGVTDAPLTTVWFFLQLHQEEAWDDNYKGELNCDDINDWINVVGVIYDTKTDTINYEDVDWTYAEEWYKEKVEIILINIELAELKTRHNLLTHKKDLMIEKRHTQSKLNIVNSKLEKLD